MARVRVTISNSSGDPIDLPEHLGGYELADGGTEHLNMDTQRFKSLYHNGKSETLETLESLETIDGVDVDIEPILTPEDQSDLEEQLEAARAFGAIGGQNLRMGTGTFSSSGPGPQTFTLPERMEDADYEVHITWTSSIAPATSTNAQHPRVTNKTATSFDITMEAAPAADATFAFLVVGNPA